MRVRKSLKSVCLVFFVLILIAFSSCSGSKSPEVVIPDQSVRQYQLLEVDLSSFVSDSESDLLFSLQEGPGRIVGSVYELVPGSDLSGRVRVSLLVRDNKGNDFSSAFFVNISEGQLPDSSKARLDFVVPQQYVEVGDVIRLGLPGFRLASDDLEFEIIEANASLNAFVEDGVLTLKPSDDAVGEDALLMRASDGEDSVEFEVPYFVRRRNLSPTLSIGDQSVVEGDSVRVDLSQFARDPDGEIVKYEVLGGPGTVSDEGIYILTAPYGSSGTHTVTVEVEDDRGGLGRGSFRVHVMPADSSERRTLIVGGEEALYTSIQAAIDQSRDGDVVLVMPGEYCENLIVDKAIELRGSSRDSVLLRGQNQNAPVIMVRTGNGFMISGMTVESNLTTIQVSRITGTIVDCHVVGGRFAVSYSSIDSSTLIVKNCSFSSLPDAEGEINSRLTGLYAYGSGSVRIEGCDFIRSGTGIYITNDVKYEIIESVFRENRIAVSVAGNTNGYISNNKFTGNAENGLLISSVGVTEVSNNMFYENVIHGLDLYLSMCTDCGCGGKVFKGTVTGGGNIFDSTEGICPQSHTWPENFYVVDELLGRSATEINQGSD